MLRETQRQPTGLSLHVLPCRYEKSLHQFPAIKEGWGRGNSSSAVKAHHIPHKRHPHQPRQRKRYKTWGAARSSRLGEAKSNQPQSRRKLLARRQAMARPTPTLKHAARRRFSRRSRSLPLPSHLRAPKPAPSSRLPSAATPSHALKKDTQRRRAAPRRLAYPDAAAAAAVAQGGQFLLGAAR